MTKRRKTKKEPAQDVTPTDATPTEVSFDAIVETTIEPMVEAKEQALAEATEEKAQAEIAVMNAVEAAQAAGLDVEVAGVEVSDADAVSEDAPTVDSTKITDEGEILQALQAVIFASPKAMSLVRLRNLLNSFNYDTSKLTDMLLLLEEQHAESGMQLVKVAGGWQYRSHPKCADLLQKLLEDKPARLSASALEVLAIVAYKQPVTRAEIDSVRGIDSGHLMKGLLEKNLVRTTGHAETPGRPLLFATTPYFLEVFTLNSLDDLPALDEMNRELVKNDAGGEGAEGDDAALLAADPDALAEAAAFLGEGSPLAANPDRGNFDAPAEDAVVTADFGIEERAREEVLN